MTQEERENLIDKLLVNHSDKFSWSNEMIKDYLKYLRTENDNPEEMKNLTLLRTEKTKLYEIIEKYDNALTILTNFQYVFEKYRNKTTMLYKLDNHRIPVFEKIVNNLNKKQIKEYSLSDFENTDPSFIEAKQNDSRFSLIYAKPTQAQFIVHLDEEIFKEKELYSKIKSIAKEKNKKVEQLSKFDVEAEFSSRAIASINVDTEQKLLTISVDSTKFSDTGDAGIEEEEKKLITSLLHYSDLNADEKNEFLAELKDSQLINKETMGNFVEIATNDSIFIISDFNKHINDVSEGFSSSVIETIDKAKYQNVMRAVTDHYNNFGTLENFISENKLFVMENYPIQAFIDKLKSDQKYDVTNSYVKGYYIMVRTKRDYENEHRTKKEDGPDCLKGKRIEAYKMEIDLTNGRIINRQSSVSKEIYDDVISKINKFYQEN